eukprot:TRINITY_DN3520_c0_g1_i5.p1 TRINITY_DN3520_c0_g1~~TRINITY_DN3520_c0_g1_i5.p1  ORF type:complete len:584 (-),score=64.32 TRINITY_DN3520_c0_g1_i5:1438-3189(-)
MFGGHGNDAGTWQGWLNDLWKYNVETGQWTWMGGTDHRETLDLSVFGSLSVTDPRNQPGQRFSPTGWVDNARRQIWLFGGRGFGLSADPEALIFHDNLWTYRVDSSQWTWMGGSNVREGPGVYGQLGVPAATNQPVGRAGALSWFDNATQELWLSGGYTFSGILSDMWKHDLVSQQWTWVAGDNVTIDDRFPLYGQLGVADQGSRPGPRLGAVGWYDTAKRELWMFGGQISDGQRVTVLNDLWKFDLSSLQWAWMGPSQTPNGVSNFAPLQEDLGTPSWIIGISAGMSAIVILLVLAAVFILIRRRHKAHFAEDAVSAPQAAVMNISSSDLILGKCLGEGSYGAVYEGEYRGQPVAIKQLSGVTSNSVGGFFREASVMMSVPAHPNVVRLIGMCQQQNFFSLVMELVPGGSLSSFLTTTTPVADSEAKQLCRGIAAGMACLASQNIVHRDLAARNVLLTESRVPKVADFGFSRVVGDDGVGKTSTDVGPIRWMAPEALRDHAFSEKSDVWAFGCLMVEVFTYGAAPFADVDLFRVAVMVRDEGHAPPIPSQAPQWAHIVMSACFQREPEYRPRFQDICGMLQS